MLQLFDDNNTEKIVCNPIQINDRGFNPLAILPYGLTTSQIKSSMQSSLDFIGFVNTQLNTQKSAGSKVS
jgi:hypothetical protein